MAQRPHSSSNLKAQGIIIVRKINVKLYYHNAHVDHSSIC